MEDDYVDPYVDPNTGSYQPPVVPDYSPPVYQQPYIPYNPPSFDVPDYQPPFEETPFYQPDYFTPNFDVPFETAPVGEQPLYGQYPSRTGLMSQPSRQPDPEEIIAAYFANQIHSGTFNTRQGIPVVKSSFDSLKYSQGAAVKPEPNINSVNNFLNKHMNLGTLRDKFLGKTGKPLNEPLFRKSLVQSYKAITSQQAAKDAEADNSTDLYQYIQDRMPFAGMKDPTGLKDTTTTDQQTAAAIARIEADNATREDFFTVAKAAKRERQNAKRGVASKFLDVLSRLPGPLGEWAVGGVAGATAASAGRFVGNLGSMSAKEAGKTAAREAVANAFFAAAGGPAGLNQAHSILKSVPRSFIASEYGEEAAHYLELGGPGGLLTRLANGDPNALEDALLKLGAFTTAEAVAKTAPIATKFLESRLAEKVKEGGTIDEAIQDFQNGAIAGEAGSKSQANGRNLPARELGATGKPKINAAPTGDPLTAAAEAFAKNEAVTPVEKPAGSLYSQRMKGLGDLAGKSVEELQALHEQTVKDEQSSDERVLGSKEKADEVDKLYRKMQSNNDKVSSAAEDRLYEITTQEQRDKLEGQGEVKPSAENIKEFLDAKKGMQSLTPDDLVKELKYALVDLPRADTPPDRMTRDEILALAKLKEAESEINKNGWNGEDISKRALASYGERFSDPEDAKYMMERFGLWKSKPESPTAAKALETPPSDIAGKTPVNPTVMPSAERTSQYRDMLNSLGIKTGKINDAAVEKKAKELQLDKFPDEDRPMAMGAAALGELTPPQGGARPSETALANANIDAQRAAEGFSPVFRKAATKNPEIYAAANEAFDRDPNVGKRLASELVEKPRPVTPLENMILLRQRVSTANEFRQLSAEYESVKGDAEAAQAMDSRLDQLAKELYDVDTAAKRTGTDWHELGMTRQQLMKEDYSLSGLLSKFRREVGRAPSREEMDQLADLQRRFEQVQEKLRSMQSSGANEDSLLGQRARIRRQTIDIDDAISDMKQKTLPVHRRVLGLTADALNSVRAIITSMDLSAVFRQGGFSVFGHPLMAAKAFKESIGAIRSQHAADVSMQKILERPNAYDYKRDGLYFSGEGKLSGREEAFMTSWAEKIPGVAASERAYRTFLDQLRADVYDSLRSGLASKGRVSPAEGQAIATFVNAATGRGGPENLGQAGVALSTIFFSPRYLASRFQLIAGQPMYGGTTATRKAIAGEYARFAVGLGVFCGLMNLLNDDAKVTLDPRSADFGKVRMGNTRIDPLTGFAQIVTLAGRVLSGQRASDQGVKPQSTQDSITTFLRNKLAPVPGAVLDLLDIAHGKTQPPHPKTVMPQSLSGQSVVGDPSVASNLLVPISFRDVYDIMVDQGIPRGVALSLLAILGMGSQVYGNPAPAAITLPPQPPIPPPL